MNDELKLSPQGENWLKNTEVLRLTPYLDQGKKWTVGWGHLMHSSEPRNETITLDRAKDLFRQDLRVVTDCIKRNVQDELLQREFDALVILVWNIGCAGFCVSHLLRMLNNGSELAEVERWWKVWNKVTIDRKLQISNGLVNRRECEWRIFTLGDYAPLHQV